MAAASEEVRVATDADAADVRVACTFGDGEVVHFLCSTERLRAASGALRRRLGDAATTRTTTLDLGRCAWSRKAVRDALRFVHDVARVPEEQDVVLAMLHPLEWLGVLGGDAPWPEASALVHGSVDPFFAWNFASMHRQLEGMPPSQRPAFLRHKRWLLQNLTLPRTTRDVDRLFGVWATVPDVFCFATVWGTPTARWLDWLHETSVDLDLATVFATHLMPGVLVGLALCNRRAMNRERYELVRPGLALPDFAALSCHTPWVARLDRGALDASLASDGAHVVPAPPLRVPCAAKRRLRGGRAYGAAASFMVRDDARSVGRIKGLLRRLSLHPGASVHEPSLGAICYDGRARHVCYLPDRPNDATAVFVMDGGCARVSTLGAAEDYEAFLPASARPATVRRLGPGRCYAVVVEYARPGVKAAA